MEVYNLHTMQKEESISSPLSVALGNFDGVHIGHAKLIKQAVKYAKEHKISSAVWTFSDGIESLPNKPGADAITSTQEKLALIAKMDVDYAILEDFNSVRDLAPDEFVDNVLVGKCGAVCAVCGFNFRFGKGGKADSDLLARLIKPRDCIVVPPVYLDAEIVSSTSVRRLIQDGEMESASRYLGHAFSISAVVVKGKQLGRTFDIPTINQYFLKGHVVPKEGIYACTVLIDGEGYHAVSNVGTRPSIEADDHLINCETHIIDYNGCLYDKEVTVSFHKRLRDEKKFESIAELALQIKRDIEDAREYFRINNI